METPLHLSFIGPLEVPTQEAFFLLVPAGKLGTAAKAWLSGTLNGQPFQGAAAPWEGGHIVSVPKEFALALGLGEGSPATLECDISLAPPPEPAPLSAAVPTPALTPEAQEAYMRLVLDKGGDLPSEVRGWNWGAVLLGPVWGPYYGKWSSLLFLLPYVGALSSSLNALAVVGFIISIPLTVQFGRRGNEWAWKSRTWASPEEFKAVQRAWALWSWIGLVVVSVLVFAVLYHFYMKLYSGSLGGLEGINPDTLQGLDLQGL